MHRSVAVLISLAGLAAAQTGYGRFPCTIVNGDNTFSPDPSQCLAEFLVAPGADTSGALIQGDRPTPVNPVCQQDTASGAYFCGIAGAACTSNSNCDNGLCIAGQCQGGFSQACDNTDTNCLGYLYCLAGDFSVASNTCGGLGAFCQDPVAVDPTFDGIQAQPIYNQFCGSGYCNAGTGLCDTLVAVGGDCTLDPQFACGPNAFCNNQNVCVANPTTQPSAGARARSRRAEHFGKRSLCPATHNACSVEGQKGFECVDVTSNIEQCGACASQGGVDCTAIEGAESVGCVAGVCEIWACSEGFEWNGEACTASFHL
ncbi:hypothetical protein JCM8547_003665 [Rhodosporidiobolus lusitaniae]